MGPVVVPYGMWIPYGPKWAYGQGASPLVVRQKSVFPAGNLINDVITIPNGQIFQPLQLMICYCSLLHKYLIGRRTLKRLTFQSSCKKFCDKMFTWF